MVNGEISALNEIQAQFPQFAIWREALRDRIRYIARARDLTTALHTVVTADLEELDALLRANTAPSTSAPAGGTPATRNYAHTSATS
jgi:hypothetical protein